MSYSDFLHCMTPYNFGELLEQGEINEYLKDHTPSILKIADSDHDGKISYTEFIFFLTLYQAPDGKVRKMFKKGGDKKMHSLNKTEFVEGMTLLRTKSSTGQKSQDKHAIDARKIKVS